MVDFTLISLNQVLNLVHKLDDAQYSQSLALFSGHSIGEHVRHIIELYQVFEKSYSSGLVEYDKRPRNKLIETSKPYAIECIEALKIAVSAIEPNKVIVVSASCDPEAKAPKVKSTTDRELLYNIEHTTHHLALIKIGIKTCFPDIELDEQIGLAPATLKFKRA